MAETEKTARVLELYRRFSDGVHLCMERMMGDYGVNRRTVQRDLEIMRDIGGLELIFPENECPENECHTH